MAVVVVAAAVNLESHLPTHKRQISDLEVVVRRPKRHIQRIGKPNGSQDHNAEGSSASGIFTSLGPFILERLTFTLSTF
jgi:hypothetical protein